jgi:hypothetical protein
MLFGIRCSHLLTLRPPQSSPLDLVSIEAGLRNKFHPVSRAEVDHVIAHLNYSSAVGPDMISYEAVRRFPA